MLCASTKEKLTPTERRIAQIALSYLTEKRSGEVKGRTVYNGKLSRKWISKEDTASPTVGLQRLVTTMVIDAQENRDVMTANVMNAFIQVEMPPKLKRED